MAPKMTDNSHGTVLELGALPPEGGSRNDWTRSESDEDEEDWLTSVLDECVCSSYERPSGRIAESIKTECVVVTISTSAKIPIERLNDYKPPAKSQPRG